MSPAYQLGVTSSALTQMSRKCEYLRVNFLHPLPAPLFFIVGVHNPPDGSKKTLLDIKILLEFFLVRDVKQHYGDEKKIKATLTQRNTPH